MKKLPVLNIKGEKVSDITLNENVFGITPNDTVLYDAIRLTRNAQRQSTASTKTRSEVRGGGRKPWRQKGTGNARQGSIRAPHWVGGGVVFGPTPQKNYKLKMNRKERRLALKSALSLKAQNKELVVLDNITLESLKTKDVKKLVQDLELVGKILFVTSEDNENLYMATRNLGYAYVILANEINAFDLVNADVVVCDEAAVKILEEVLK